MSRIKGRDLRHRRIRKKMFGTSKRPRLVVHRSLKNISAQFVDDLNHKTIMSVSTNTHALREQIKYGGNVKAAAVLGELVAKKALEKGIESVFFDRSGYKYHGRVKAMAEAAKKSGLLFGKTKNQKAKNKKAGDLN